MAYLARLEPDDAAVVALPARAALQPTGFTALEWSIVRLARIDDLWTIRPMGLVRRFWNALVGRVNPVLANPRLEALRRMAVLSWHFGFTVPGEAIADFLSEGFSIAQYELLVTSIAKAINSPEQGQAPEAFA
jgi:hypothetical protein